MHTIQPFCQTNGYSVEWDKVTCSSSRIQNSITQETDFFFVKINAFLFWVHTAQWSLSDVCHKSCYIKCIASIYRSGSGIIHLYMLVVSIQRRKPCKAGGIRTSNIILIIYIFNCFFVLNFSKLNLVRWILWGISPCVEIQTKFLACKIEKHYSWFILVLHRSRGLINDARGDSPVSQRVFQQHADGRWLSHPGTARVPTAIQSLPPSYHGKILAYGV